MFSVLQHGLMAWHAMAERPLGGVAGWPRGRSGAGGGMAGPLGHPYINIDFKYKETY